MRTMFSAAALAAAVINNLFANWIAEPAGVAYAWTFAADSAEQKMFLGISRGGFWQGGNSGDLWVPSNVSLLPDAYFVPYDLHILDPGGDTVIVRCATAYASPTQLNSEVWWTLDGGLQWTHFPENLILGSAGDFLAINPHRHNSWLHLDFNRLHVSINYGQNWGIRTLPALCQGQKSSFCFDPDHDSTIYFASVYQYSEGQSYGGAWKSEDLGTTWNLLLDLHGLFGLSFAAVSDVKRLSNGDIITTIRNTDADWQNGTILISDNEGVTWDRIYDGLPDRFNPVEVIEDCSQPGTILVRSSEKHGVYRSLDYGHTWSRCGNGFPPNVAMASDLEQNCFSGTIYVCVAGYGVLGSTDHGESWQDVSPLPPVGSIGYFGAVDSNVFVMNDGFRHWMLDDGSNEWNEVIPPLAQDTLVQMRPVSYCSGDTLVTGLWKRNRVGAATDHFQMAFSYDHGATLSLQPFLDFLPRWLFSVGKVEDQTLFFAFDAYFMLRSTDLGLTWEDASLPAGYWLDHGVVFTDTCIFADGSNYQTNDYDVFRSYDLGDIWEPLNYPGPFAYSSTALLTKVGNELVLIAEDTCWAWSSGQWQQRGEIIGLPDPALIDLTWMVAVPFADQTLLFGLTWIYNQAWVSADTGRTWQVRTIEPPYADQSIGFEGLKYSTEQHRIWAIAGVGTCYLEADELLAASGPLVLKPADYTLLAVYPNPFNSETSIRYDLLKREHVEIGLYNIEGKLVRTLADDVQSAGRHELNLNMYDTASGLYFVRLQTPSHVQTTKIILLK